VLETGTAVTMPWLDRAAGVIEAWYAGSAGHQALANVLVGNVNPSGKLAISFPKSEKDLPRAVITPAPPKDQKLTYVVHYDEGPKVGYKWYEAEKKQPLFAFGFGLSFTTYEYSALNVDSAAKTVRFAVKNTGKRVGTEIVEVYAKLPEGADESFKRLVGWKRLSLSPGESQTITVAVDDRPLQTFDETNNRWIFAPGDYQILVGPSSDNLPLTGKLSVR
jgi:beta-glucosidase